MAEKIAILAKSNLGANYVKKKHIPILLEIIFLIFPVNYTRRYS